MSETVETLPDTSPRDKTILQNMANAGVATFEKVQADYFGFDSVQRITFPDGVSYVDHRVLNEGARRKYLKATNKDVRIQAQTKDAFLKMQQGEDRAALLETAIVGWNLTSGGVPMPFEPKNLTLFLNRADPKIIDLIYKEISKANPWLLGEMTSEDIQKEIDSLIEMKKIREDEELGKASS